MELAFQSRYVTGPNIGTARIASRWSTVSPVLRKPCRWPAGTITDCPAITVMRSSPTQISAQPSSTVSTSSTVCR